MRSPPRSQRQTSLLFISISISSEPQAVLLDWLLAALLNCVSSNTLWPAKKGTPIVIIFPGAASINYSNLRLHQHQQSASRIRVILDPPEPCIERNCTQDKVIAKPANHYVNQVPPFWIVIFKNQILILKFCTSSRPPQLDSGLTLATLFRMVWLRSDFNLSSVI